MMLVWNRQTTQHWKEVREQLNINKNCNSPKCSFLDDEPVGHSGQYKGKRIYNATCHGGLFRSSIGKIINADVQGGYNIIKKAIPKAFVNLVTIRSKRTAKAVDGIECVGLHPIRINPLG